jgi:hypothetical protein
MAKKPISAFNLRHLRAHEEAFLPDKTGGSIPQFPARGSRTRPHRICRSRGVFGTGTNPTKNIDRATIATAAATRVDARSLATRGDALALASTANSKAATLLGRTLGVCLAAHTWARVLCVGGAIDYRVRLAVTAGRTAA